jgi:hypothetical protein
LTRYADRCSRFRIYPVKLTLNPAFQNRFRAPGSEGRLLLWLKDVERAIDHVPEVSRLVRYLYRNPVLTPLPDIPQADLQSSVESLHSTFTKLLIYSSQNPSSLPKPGRPARQIIARSIIKLHRRIESRTLFDLVQELLKVVVDNNGNVFKGGADSTYRA